MRHKSYRHFLMTAPSTTSLLWSAELLDEPSLYIKMWLNHCAKHGLSRSGKPEGLMGGKVNGKAALSLSLQQRIKELRQKKLAAQRLVEQSA